MIDLSSGAQTPPATGTGGVQIYPVAITDGEVAGKIVGSYSDTISDHQ